LKSQPELAGKVPEDPKFVKTSVAMDALVIKTLDARYYLVRWDAQPQVMPAEEALQSIESMAQSSPEKAFTYLKPGGVPLQVLSSPDMARNAHFENGRLLTLLTDEAFSEVTQQRPDSAGRVSVGHSKPYADGARHLYSGEAMIGQSQLTGIASVSMAQGALTRLVDDRYLNGGFLVDTRVIPNSLGFQADSTLHLRDPVSTLILSRPDLGRHSGWTLNRVGLDGQSLWQAHVEAERILQVFTTGEMVVFSDLPPAGDGERPARLRFEIFRLDDGTRNVITADLP